MMKTFKVPDRFNYIGVFLTLRCNYGCSYCINRNGDLKKHNEMTPDQWIEGLSRLETKPDLPLTLQGGEPTQYEGWREIANSLWRISKPLDLLTNGSFRLSDMYALSPQVFNREAKYASIRVSFHPLQHDSHALATKIFILNNAGYNIGIWGLGSSGLKNQNRLMKKICENYNLDFRLKEFLGNYQGAFYGDMKYKGACIGDCEDPQFKEEVECRTSELLIGPSGHIYKCHADLYAGRKSIAHILDEEIKGVGEWGKCENYGVCNPCDIKIKNNRFQEMGHTSVEVREVSKG